METIDKKVNSDYYVKSNTAKNKSKIDDVDKLAFLKEQDGLKALTFNPFRVTENLSDKRRYTNFNVLKIKEVMRLSDNTIQLFFFFAGKLKKDNSFSFNNKYGYGKCGYKTPMECYRGIIALKKAGIIADGPNPNTYWMNVEFASNKKISRITKERMKKKKSEQKNLINIAYLNNCNKTGVVEHDSDEY